MKANFYQLNIVILMMAMGILFSMENVSAQVGKLSNCGGNVPYFYIDMTGTPDSVWSSPMISRNGQCCGANPPDQCISFELILDSSAVGIQIDMTGADPAGSLYYDIECSGNYPGGTLKCISGVGPHYITFCKPGFNTNEYIISSISKPLFPDDDSVRIGCSNQLELLGIKDSTVTWTSVAPDTLGAYNSYLSCTNCTEPIYTPSVDAPAIIDYYVCGYPIADSCGLVLQVCDTIRIYNIDSLIPQLIPEAPVFCDIDSTSGINIVASLTGGDGNYSYTWKDSSGTIVSTDTFYFATEAGKYYLEAKDGLTGGLCPTSVDSIIVKTTNLPVVNAGPDKILCASEPSASLNGTVQNANGGTWNGGNGTFSPHRDSLSVTYTPTASEINNGSVELILTSTGSGASCPNLTDTLIIFYMDSINTTVGISSNYNSRDISCNGSSDGEATVTVSGGTPPFSYLWNDMATQTSVTASGLPAGTYYVQVVDSIGCIDSASVTLTEPDSLIVSAAVTSSHNGRDISCNGASDGQATASVSGGTSAYSYLWNDGSGQSTAIASGLSAGTYQVTVTDANGCIDSASVTLTEPDSLIVSAAVTSSHNGRDISCNGASDGQATASVSGGTSAYSYLWNDGSGQTTAIASGLSAGTYQVTGTDANGCIDSASVTLTEPDSLLVTTAVTSDHNGRDISCNGASNGQATASVSGGTIGYSYLWSDASAQTSIVASGLSAGIYQVTVTDTNGCKASGNVTLTEPDSLIVSAAVTSSHNGRDISCNGASDGQATASVSGGTSAYSCLWNDGSGQTTAMASGLSAGTYQVTVTDTNGCIDSASITLADPNSLAVSATVTSDHNSRDISCNGASDGQATASVSGGTSAYSYLWNDGSGQTTAIASGLSAGTYQVTVTDANGCIDSASVTLTEPDSLLITATVTSDQNGRDISCNGASDGQATASVSGGTSAYSYLWNDGSGQTTAIASGLSAGTYQVIGTDANGCIDSASVTLTEPDSLIVSAAVTSSHNGRDISCNGASDGQATASVSGGTSAYSYLWNDGSGQTTAIASGLSAGTYQVTVTDTNGCTASGDVTLTEPDSLIVSAAVTSSHNGRDISCNGASDGQATASVSGGTSAYLYLWNDGSGQTTTMASGLSAGTYQVTVTDANGCIDSASVTLTDPNSLAVSATVTSDHNGRDISCNGASDGQATASVSGGTSAYSYLWNDGSGQTTAIASGLSAGTYQVTVTDANGCIDSASVTLTEPDSMIANANVTSDFNGLDISCNGERDGEAMAIASGGTGPYSYKWNDPKDQTTQTASKIFAGTYQVTVTDANGCIDSASVTLTEPDSLIVSAAVTSSHNGRNISCNGASDGQATASVSGGTSAYSYLWNDGSGQTTAIASGLSAGTYQVTITDTNGCTASGNVTLTEPDSLIVSTAVTSSHNGRDISCNGASDGQATTSVSGGTSAYLYLWNDGSGQTTTMASGLSAGTYQVTVTDANGCIDSASVTLTDPNSLAVSATVTSDHNGRDISCYGASDGQATASVSGGTSAYSYLWNDGSGQTTAIASGLSAGTYQVTVTDANGCIDSASVTLTEPDSLLVTAAVTSDHNGRDISCNGERDGEAMAIASGGTGPYSYQWNDPKDQTTQTASKIFAGTYQVTVTDANGCIDSASVTLTEPDSLLVTAAVTSGHNGRDISCNGASDGQATASVSGGTSAYSYLWNDGSGQTTAIASGLSAGTYQVTVTDTNGCTASDNVTLTEPDSLIASALVTSNFGGQDVSCDGAADGEAKVSVIGGTGSYTYLWDSSAGGQTTATATGLTAGTYMVQVTDSNGCITTASITLQDPGFLTAATSVISDYNGREISCNGATDGMAVVSGSGGTGSYTYSWNDPANQTNDTASGLAAGTYMVTVTDSNGCTATASVTLTEPDSLIVNTTVTSDYNGMDVSCNGERNGEAMATVSGGTGPYSYQWNDPKDQTTQTASKLFAGTYIVQVTDINGCVVEDSVTLSQPDSLITNYTGVYSGYNGRDVSCHGAYDGVAGVSASGGMAPYSYLWSNGQDSSVAMGLSAGTYTVLTTDINNCTTEGTVTIVEPDSLAATARVVSDYNGQNISCNGGADGSAIVEVSGGTEPYIYLWNDNASQTTAQANGLIAGIYTVQVTDANGCVTSVSVTLTEPSLLTSSTQVASDYNGEDISCNGESDGSAISIVNGGTQPYSYQWSNGQTSATASGLAAGTYKMIVTDVNGCIDSANITLTEPDSVIANAIVTSDFNGQGISCIGKRDGEAMVNASGGTEPYAYQWNDSKNQVTETASKLFAGTFIVEVTDINGCTAKDSVTLSGPDSLVTMEAGVYSDYNGRDVSCKGASDGKAAVSPSGGTAPYTYQWSNGQDSSVATGLSAGTYQVTTTDLNGCTTTSVINIVEPDECIADARVVSDYNGQNISCSGGTDGVVTVDVTGGTPPFSYSWNDDAGQTTAQASGLAAGVYTVQVTDVNGCMATALVTLREPDPLAATTSVTSDYNGQDISCNGASDGSANVQVNGGTQPYSYLWSNGQTTATVSGLSAGTYSVQVTDVNGCTTDKAVTLTEPDQLQMSLNSVNNFNGSQISCAGASDGAINININGGTAPYSYQWNNGQTTKDINGLGAGTYTVSVTDVNGCVTSGEITLTEPDPLSISASVTSDYNGFAISCNGATDGSIATSASGGTPGYQYNWSTGATTADLMGIGAGTYTVTVTDQNGCTANATVTLDQPDALTSTAVATNNFNGFGVSCSGASDGAINLTVNGGSGGYSYSWNNGATSEDLTDVGAGTYNVTVTDQNGCTNTASATISEPDPLTTMTEVLSNFNGQDISCNGATDGSATVTVSGGIGAYSYLWSNGATTQQIDNLGTGVYSVTVTDANGCSSTEDIELTAPDPFLANATLTSDFNGFGVSCNGASDGAAEVQITGGTPQYAIAWNNGTNGPSLSGVSAGNYTATILDANGCMTTASIQVTEPDKLDANVVTASDYNGFNISCNGGTDGAADLTVNGGVPPYSYIWSNGSISQDISSLGAGVYEVTVTDANGCTATDSVRLDEPEPVKVSGTTVDVTCNGFSNGSVDITVIGGVSNYTYNWSNGATSEDIQGISAGNYSLLVTDANGCTKQQTFTIDETDPVTIASQTSMVSCNGESDGEISVTAGGGTPPYSVTWADNFTGSQRNNLAAGEYIATITDINGCSVTDTIVISQPDTLTIMLKSPLKGNNHNISINNGNDGVIKTTVTGGSTPFEYHWSTGDTTQHLSNLSQGTYTVMVTDVNGCEATASISLTHPKDLRMPTAFSPNGDGDNDIFVIKGLTDYPDNELVIFNRWGNIVFDRKDYRNTWDGRNNKGETLPDGTYFAIFKAKTSNITLSGYVDLRR